MTFEDLFWQTLHDHLPYWYEQIIDYNERHSVDGRRTTLSPWRTYSFELTSPHSRIVCSYGAAGRLTLIGVRENFGEFLELEVSQFADYFPVVQEYPISTALEAIAAADELNPMASEGFVVVDKHFNRLKIKSSKYVQIHHLVTGNSIRPMIRLVRTGETNEFLAYFPKYQGMIDEIATKVDAYVVDVEAAWTGLRHITEKKAFALEAIKTKHSHMLFALYQGQTDSVRERLMHDKKPDGQFVISGEKFAELIRLNSQTALPPANPS